MTAVQEYFYTPRHCQRQYGIGTLGQEAFNWIDFLAASGQRLWQVMPLGPTGYGDSPYQCFSAFGGESLFNQSGKTR